MKTSPGTEVNMLYLTHVALLLLPWIKDVASGMAADTPEVIEVRIGESLTLDCTYNCSSGFLRSHWKWEEKPACSSCDWEEKRNHSEDICTLSLHTHNLTVEQTLYNYSCVTEKNDDQTLPMKTERLISLQKTVDHIDVSMKVLIFMNDEDENDHVEVGSLHSIQVPVGAHLKMKCLSTDKHCEGLWMKDQDTHPEANSGSLLLWDKITEEDGGRYTCKTEQFCTSQRIPIIIEIIKDDEFAWIKALAAIALCAVIALMLVLTYLCYKRRSSFSEPEDSTTAIYENTRTKHEMTAIKPIVKDCESDHEVPYADIVISVRGSSIPELTGIHSGQAPRDHRLRWKEEAAGGSRLQACRSADRLHVHPREVSRKLSTTSEYAIITYSTEAFS